MIYPEMEAARKPNMTFSLTMRKLLDVHTAAQAEINARFQEIFLRHRGIAFAGRNGSISASLDARLGGVKL